MELENLQGSLVFTVWSSLEYTSLHRFVWSGSKCLKSSFLNGSKYLQRYAVNLFKFILLPLFQYWIMHISLSVFASLDEKKIALKNNLFIWSGLAWQSVVSTIIFCVLFVSFWYCVSAFYLYVTSSLFKKKVLLEMGFSRCVGGINFIALFHTTYIVCEERRNVM